MDVGFPTCPCRCLSQAPVGGRHRRAIADLEFNGAPLAISPGPHCNAVEAWHTRVRTDVGLRDGFYVMQPMPMRPVGSRRCRSPAGVRRHRRRRLASPSTTSAVEASGSTSGIMKFSPDSSRST